VACRELSHPIFPFVGLTTTFRKENGRLAVTEHQREASAVDLAHLGTGFSRIFRWRSGFTAPYLRLLNDVIQDMVDFTIVLENHANGRYMEQTSQEIIDQRNFVQHRLMSVQSEAEVIAATQRCDPQYEACRLACIVYSFLIILPMPPIFGPFEQLTTSLRHALPDLQSMMLYQDRWHLQIWILVMGAIGSLGLSEHGWYVQQLSVAVSNMQTIKELHHILQQFIWHPRTSSCDLTDLWNELQEPVALQIAQ
jgi:hypothetical protein